MASSNSKTVEILVVDYMIDSLGLRPHYEGAVPESRQALMVLDVTNAWRAFQENPAIRVVVVQGLSRVDANDLQDDAANTITLVERLVKAGFRGAVFVVSMSLSAKDRARLDATTGPVQVRVMDKWDFFRQGRDLLSEVFTPARAELERRFKAAAESVALGASDTFEAIGLTLEHLDQLAEDVKAGDPSRVLQSLILGDLYPSCGCNCQEWGDISWMVWIHTRHGLVNKAFWEVLTSGPDDNLVYRVVNELHEDLKSPDQYIGGDGPFGRHVRKDYGRLLTGFLRLDGPQPEWLV